MRRIKTLCTIILLLLITGTVESQKKNITSPFFFIQVTDPQFGFFDSNNGFAKETELFEKAVDAINRLNPDFVVITGDLVNNLEDKNQINEFKRITAKINPKIPVYYSPGNHNIGQSPVQQDVDSFVSEYGHDRFSFRHNNILFIGLNSVLIKANSPLLEQQQFKWLKKKLMKGKNANHRILFCHYPFFISNPGEAETYSNISPETRIRYLNLFKEYNVDAIFAGHLHNNGFAKSGNMEMVTTSAVGKPLAGVPSGIRIVKVFNDRIESIYYGLDEIPPQIDLKNNPVGRESRFCYAGLCFLTY
jgi:serine/threonine-protein phosphatase CPPED1